MKVVIRVSKSPDYNSAQPTTEITGVPEVHLCQLDFGCMIGCPSMMKNNKSEE